MLPLSNAFLGKQTMSVLRFALNSSGAGSAAVAAQPLPAWWCQKVVYWERRWLNWGKRIIPSPPQSSPRYQALHISRI